MRVLLLSALLFLVSGISSWATHLRAGEITVERVGSRTYRITVTVYTNVCGTTVLFGGDQDFLDFGDGTNLFKIPETRGTPRPDLDPSGCVNSASYTVIHAYSGQGQYKISYREMYRNENVLNMKNSGGTNFYVETVLNIDGFFGINNSPRLLIPPVDMACKGVAWFHNPGAYDPDGDSLSYELDIPFQEIGQKVNDYKSPDDRKFYTNFNNANEDGDGQPEFKINPITGTLTWDAPGAVGEYNIAFHIIEWRKIGDEWYKIGYVRRDMQILVDDCDNRRPDIIIPNDTCVVAGTKLEAIIRGLDPDNDSVKVEAFSEIFNFAPAQSPASINPKPGINDFRYPDPPVITTFTWNTECIHIKDQPYQVVFKITDKGNPRLVTYKSWFIRVIGAAPEWESAQLDLSQRRATVNWKPYECSNAETMQVWRKVEGTPYVPDNCITGMPEYLGYDLIATVNLSSGTTSFIDTNGGKGLAPGAKYCYRLVAIFAAPQGGESYVSQDICVGPIIADEPVITHVTVEKTSVTTGEVRVSWRKPFEADDTQFPEPYTYDVWRSNGFVRGSDSVKVASGISDTTFVDKNINTEQTVFAYSVTAFSATNGLLGSSKSASMVRLDTRSTVDQIELNWSAFVPWTNRLAGSPSKHLIYRGPEGADETELVLIDSVDVFAGGFTYVDDDLPDNAATYCYRIMTRGGYGNPKIKLPLKNFSQIICAQVGDDEPPCVPEPPKRSTLDFVDCQDFLDRFCEGDTYRNILTWNRAETEECRLDVKSYNVYAANKKGEDFVLIAENVVDTFYVDDNRPSFARCYKISAVDRSGNESELSEELCIDNCPYYELPNVFTPNGDTRNETFSAYGNFDCVGEDCDIPSEIRFKCARFVLEVNLKIYNRWGQQVYSFIGKRGSETETIYIKWNGLDSQGNELATGIYYYNAEVTFERVDPSKKVTQYKGWVHLIR